MDNFLQQSLKHHATAFAKKQLAIADKDNQFDAPPFFQTADKDEEPPRLPGALWFVREEGQIYFFSEEYQDWCATSTFFLSGLPVLNMVERDRWLVRCFAVPERTILLRATFGCFAAPGAAGIARLNAVHGNTLGETSFVMGATGYGEIVLTIGVTLNYGAGLKAEIELDSGNIPGVVDVLLEGRRILKK